MVQKLNEISEFQYNSPLVPAKVDLRGPPAALLRATPEAEG